MPYIDSTEMLRGSPLPGWSGRFFHSENMTFALWGIAADTADLHSHDHAQEEVWNVVDGEEWRLEPGAAAVVPPHTVHSARPLGVSRVIVTDYPIRDQLPGVGSI